MANEDKDALLEWAERIIDGLLDQQAMPDESFDKEIEEWREEKRQLD